jgi:valyl-tRNA synthetase
MCKLRLYDSDHPQRPGALQALQRVLLDTLKLFAPILPFVTEEIYQGLFAPGASDLKFASIHTLAWPEYNPALEDKQAEEFGVTVALTRKNTMEAIEAIDRVFGKTRLGETAKLRQFQALLEKYCDFKKLYQALGLKKA